MRSDKFGNPIYQEDDLIKLFYTRPDLVESVIVDFSNDIQRFEKFSNLSLTVFNPSIESVSVEEFDKVCREEWFLPEEYKQFDIEEFLVTVCPENNLPRLLEELEEFKSRNLFSLLKLLKYIVDTLREKKVLWGVGRGSSVASYVFYLLGVHRVDSVKYQLDWREFLR